MQPLLLKSGHCSHQMTRKSRPVENSKQIADLTAQSQKDLPNYQSKLDNGWPESVEEQVTQV